MKKILSILFILSTVTHAGLPPASTKGAGDAVYKTTFQTDYGLIPLTHTGAKATIGTIPTTMGGTGSTNLGTGVLRATAGAIATGSVSLLTDVSSILPVANGGTGSATRNYVDLVSSESIGGTKTFTSTIAGSINGNAATVTTNANLTGEVTSVGNATTVTNSAVIGKVLTGYVSGAGTVAATDTILQAIQKLNGNNATNANLTGPITSVGNATSIASQTGTGTKFVVDTSPTLVTPIIGAATGTSLSVSGQLTSTVATGTAPLAVTSTTKVTNLYADRAALADTVTTNANLTGDVTSVGNATTYTTVPATKGGTAQTTYATGDMIYASAANTLSKLTIGSTSNYLTVAGGVPAWTSVSPNTIKIATITDVKAAGTSGGTFTSGSWQTRTLNTLVDPTSIVTSLASNQFVLPAGTYYIQVYAPANQVNHNIAKLKNITDSTDTLLGTTSHSSSAASGNQYSVIQGSFTIAGSKTFEIQHMCGSTEATDGFGWANSTFAGVSETYTTVRIEKM